MRKIFAALLLATMILALCACGGANQPNGSDPTATTQPGGTEEATQSALATDPNHQHTYTDQVVAPTCTKEGYTLHTCACGDSYKDNVVAATPHTYKETTLEPTCTEDGGKVFTCDCGDTYKENVQKATGHKWGDWQTVKEPTTTAEGKAERKCSQCKQTESRKIDKIIENHTHKYTEQVTTQATCTADGIKTFTCSCGGSYTESIARKAHEYAKTTTNPTCTARGYVTAKCKGCTESYIEKYIAATGHSYADTVTKPTCTVKGSTKHMCKICKAETVDTYVAALGHDMDGGKVTTEPGCTNDGVKTYACKRSGCTHTTTESIAAIGHDYKSETVAATCTTGGKTVHKCSRCSASYEDGKTAALGHSTSKSKTVAPTCGSKGYDVYKCSRCDYTENKNYTNPSGSHDYKVTSNTATCTKSGVKTYTCSGCGATKTENVAASGSHQLETMTVSKAASKCADLGNSGLQKYSRMTDINITICTKCGYADYESACSIYTAAQETNIMVGLTQPVRREFLYNDAIEAGDTPEQAEQYFENYKHIADSISINHAKRRAQEIVSDYSHNGMPINYRENINMGAQNIQTDFENWINSSGHYKNIIHSDYNFVGYSRCVVGDNDTETITVYSVMLMGYHRR